MTKSGSAAIFGDVYTGKKIFLTGHTGFKGAWLSEWLLLLGAEVIGYSIDSVEPSLFTDLQLSARLRDVRGDVRDLPLLTKVMKQCRPDFVFHLAAQPLVRYSYSDPVATFSTNVIGTINVMEVLRSMHRPCAAVMVTTDKCYDNKETSHAYSETDPLGGHDPYSSSKAAAEIAIDSYRKSFFANGSSNVIALASARAGNVIGGGDWAEDRLVPDCIRALQANKTVPVRNQNATRPWQHVLDPLSGYLTLGAALWQELQKPGTREDVHSAFNFGPDPESNRTVRDVVNEVLKHWPGQWIDKQIEDAPHEAGLLNLNIDRAKQILKWRPVWNFEETVAQTVAWYRDANGNAEASALTRRQIDQYQRDAATRGLPWAGK